MPDAVGEKREVLLCVRIGVNAHLYASVHTHPDIFIAYIKPVRKCVYLKHGTRSFCGRDNFFNNLIRQQEILAKSFIGPDTEMGELLFEFVYCHSISSIIYSHGC